MKALKTVPAFEDVRDIKRQHDVGRFFQGADMLVQEPQLGLDFGLVPPSERTEE